MTEKASMLIKQHALKKHMENIVEKFKDLIDQAETDPQLYFNRVRISFYQDSNCCLRY